MPVPTRYREPPYPFPTTMLALDQVSGTYCFASPREERDESGRDTVNGFLDIN